MLSQEKAEQYANKIAWLYDEDFNAHFGVPRKSNKVPYDAKEWREIYKAERFA